MNSFPSICLRILKVSLFSILFLAQSAMAQESKLSLKLNALAGIGTTWHTVDFSDPSNYDSKTIAYSGGGGVGLEAGVGYLVLPKLVAEFSVAFQQVLGLQSTNGYTSSAFFNRKAFYTGAKYMIPLTKKEKGLSLNFGAGAGFLIPGTLKITENDNYLGSIGFKNRITGYSLTELQIPLRKLTLNAGLRFRKVTFKADYYSKGKVENLDSKFQNFSGTGFDLYAGFNFNL